jgi:cobalt-zinc-cadmium efflux system protein
MRASGHDHSHVHEGASARSLGIALALTTGFMVVEAVVAALTGSLALISDAAHMFTDSAALAIALAAIHIGKRAADERRTFGYYRFEILAAAFNAVLLFVAAAYILYEAYLRLRMPQEVQSTGMLATAIVGLVVNLIAMRVLAGGAEKSLNVKGAYLEVWSDLLGSLGVFTGAIVIRYTGWQWVDSVVAVLIGLWVMPRTWTLLKASVNILLEGVPDDVEIEEVTRVLLATPGISSIHDLHVWSLTSGKTSLTVHVVVEAGVDTATFVLPRIRTDLREQFAITHVTVQCELSPCGQTHDESHFGSANPRATHEHEHGFAHGEHDSHSHERRGS